MAIYWKTLLTRPIAFHPPLAEISGSVTAGILLSQMVYWSTRTKNKDGWFYKTREDWKQETALTRREQETARKMLKERGLIEEALRGVPATLHFRVLDENVEKALVIYCKSLELNSWHESAQLVGTKAPNKMGGNVPTSRAESAQHLSLSETTTEITHSAFADLVNLSIEESHRTGEDVNAIIARRKLDAV
jgi:hypothetical protein